MAKAQRKAKEEPAPTKLDLGCGKNPRSGFVGVDSRDFGQAITHDLRKPWPWADGSIEEVHCSHFVEHLTAPERIHFVNELHRILKPGGKATIIVPHWGSCRAYGDLTHQWPPVSEFWFYYLSKQWRDSQAPHNDGYTCDFEAVWGYSDGAALAGKNDEFRQFAYANFKEAIADMHATLTKK